MIDVISILVLLVVIGFALWLIEQAPLDAQIKRIIQGIAIFLVIIYVLQSLGLFGGVGVLR